MNISPKSFKLFWSLFWTGRHLDFIYLYGLYLLQIYFVNFKVSQRARRAGTCVRRAVAAEGWQTGLCGRLQEQTVQLDGEEPVWTWATVEEDSFKVGHSGSLTDQRYLPLWADIKMAAPRGITRVLLGWPSDWPQINCSWNHITDVCSGLSNMILFFSKTTQLQTKSSKSFHTPEHGYKEHPVHHSVSADQRTRVRSKTQVPKTELKPDLRKPAKIERNINRTDWLEKSNCRGDYFVKPEPPNAKKILAQRRNSTSFSTVTLGEADYEPYKGLNHGVITASALMDLRTSIR